MWVYAVFFDNPKKVLAITYTRCYNVKRSFLKGGFSRESEIISKTDLREMQSHQEKRENHDHL